MEVDVEKLLAELETTKKELELRTQERDSARAERDERTRERDAIRAERDEKEEELIEARICPVTGLWRQYLTDKYMTAMILWCIRQLPAQRLMQGAELTELTMRDLLNLGQGIAFLDLSYLWALNEAGHGVGDRGLWTQSHAVMDRLDGTLVPAINNEEGLIHLPRHRGFRNGGDEMVFIMRGDPRETKSIVLAGIDQYRNTPFPEVELPPNSDVGFCFLPEALQAYAIWVKIYGEPTGPKDRMTLIKKLMFGISHRRCKANKVETRILFLAWMRLNQTERYERLFSSLNKGTGLLKETIEKLVRAAKQGMTRDVLEEVLTEEVKMLVNQQIDSRIATAKDIMDDIHSTEKQIHNAKMAAFVEEFARGNITSFRDHIHGKLVLEA